MVEGKRESRVNGVESPRPSRRLPFQGPLRIPNLSFEVAGKVSRESVPVPGSGTHFCEGYFAVGAGPGTRVESPFDRAGVAAGLSGSDTRLVVARTDWRHDGRGFVSRQ